MTSYDDLHLDRLARVVATMERGDWRAALALLLRRGGPGDLGELVDLEIALRCVARSMSFQCVLGDVRAARHQLDTAWASLHTSGAGRARNRGIAQLLRSTTRLVRREESDLDAVRAVFGEIPRGRPELVYACIEHLTWVEFDPWTMQVHEDDRTLVRIDDDEHVLVGNRRDICARATRLRQFANARNGSVNEKTWQRMGGYPGVRQEALHKLAEEPVSRRSHVAPVRFGRLRAWEFARQWVLDTSI